VYEIDETKDSNIYAKTISNVELRQLTNNPANDRFPMWSPDGNKIAFESNRRGNYQIWICDSAGQN
jgi:Tol biopolymer transport system component